MKAGIDLGTTLTKVVFKKNNDFKFFSQADYSIKQIAKILKQNKITSASIVGINKLPAEFKFLKINKIKSKNLINREIKLQVKGLEKLYNLQNKKIFKNYVLVSIGTGISYTVIAGKKIKKLNIGSSIGGGTIFGLSKILGFKDFKQLVKIASEGNHKKTDIYFKNLIVSNLADLNKKTNKKDLAAGLMNLLAITVYKDLMLYKLDKQNIIVIGSTLKNNFYLQKLLKKYLDKIHFISEGEFTTCLGALIS